MILGNQKVSTGSDLAIEAIFVGTCGAGADAGVGWVETRDAAGFTEKLPEKVIIWL